MNIYLIGFMGVGKSTIGKKLANRLGLKYVDLDQVIVNKENRSIEKIFQKEGEDYFRVLETKSLTNLKGDHQIISVGGGTPCFHNNMKFMMVHGIVVYLKADIQIILSRLLNSKTKRPLIENEKEHPERLNKKIEELMNDREPVYSQAHIKFNVADLNAKRMDELIEKIKSLSVA